MDASPMMTILTFLIVVLLWAISSSINRVAKLIKILVKFELIGELPPLLQAMYDETQKEEGSKTTDEIVEDENEDEGENIENPLKVSWPKK